MMLEITYLELIRMILEDIKNGDTEYLLNKGIFFKDFGHLIVSAYECNIYLEILEKMVAISFTADDSKSIHFLKLTAKGLNLLENKQTLAKELEKYNIEPHNPVDNEADEYNEELDENFDSEDNNLETEVCIPEEEIIE